LSFAETEYEHQILRVTCDGAKLMSVETILVPRAAMLLRIPAEESALIEDVLPQLEALDLDDQLPPEQYPFLEVRITEHGPDPMRRRRVEQAIDGKPVRLASIKVERAMREETTTDAGSIQQHLDLKSIDPQDIFLDAWRERYGIEPDTRVVAAFREILLAETRDG